MTSASIEAWLVHLSSELRAAIGLREMLFVLPDQGVTHTVPRASAHASRVLMWQQKLVPLIDLQVYVTGAASPAAQNMLGIVGCSAEGDTDRPTRYGALKMSRPPERIWVTDDQACDLPPHAAAWRSISASCFRHPVHGAVPILDLQTLLIPS